MAEITEPRRELALDCFLLAGKVMMESGAETYRVEDTMIRMAASQNMTDSHCFVTPSGIMFSPSNELPTRFVRVKDRRTNLARVAKVNAVSRKLVSGEFTLREAYDMMTEIDQNDYLFPMWAQVLAASAASGSFFLLLGGRWADVLFALLIGGIGFYLVEIFIEKTRVKFFSEFAASVVIGALSMAAVHFAWGTELDTIIIGSVIPLVPGLLITNAVRDLMAGHFMSGLSNGAEAFLTAFAIGAGIAVVLAF
ncbi:threonine/serine exporter family protein [Planomicrobium sp. YIM 101495]|uniref:threonine/serine exporter family protein n=1 Tax=Planomicrobium sp. YIM 101495 TaxID=2665160 RepID=UPI0012B9EC57|nr:threonine/serine exporter family protein [Planomicrobium sp. YIM 101495]MTD30931.1 threonine/serine exporter [Planomicrobium sp. YIM 101495]